MSKRFPKAKAYVRMTKTECAIFNIPQEVRARPKAFWELKALLQRIAEV